MNLVNHLFKPIDTELLKQIRQLNRIPNINNGGCILAALAIYKLAKFYGLKPTIIFMSDKHYVKKELKRGWPLGTNHVFVKIGLKYYDSTGGYWRHEVYSIYSYRHLIKVNYDLAFKCAMDYRNWNDDFDRTYGLSEINKLTNIGISRISHN